VLKDIYKNTVQTLLKVNDQPLTGQRVKFLTGLTFWPVAGNVIAKELDTDLHCFKEEI